MSQFRPPLPVLARVLRSRLNGLKAARDRLRNMGDDADFFGLILEINEHIGGVAVVAEALEALAEPDPIDPALLDAPLRDGFAEDLGRAALANAIEATVDGAASDAVLVPCGDPGCNICRAAGVAPAWAGADEPPHGDQVAS